MKKAVFITLVGVFVMSQITRCSSGPDIEKLESFTFRIIGVKGKPGYIPDDWRATTIKLLESTEGVRKGSVKSWSDAKDQRNNSVTVSLDSTRTDRAKVAASLKQVWEITWYECTCGSTAANARKCCGKQMKQIE